MFYTHVKFLCLNHKTQKSTCQLKSQQPALGQTRRPWYLSISGVKKISRRPWGVSSTTATFTQTFPKECRTSVFRNPRSSAAGRWSLWGTTFDSATKGRSELSLSIGLPVFVSLSLSDASVTAVFIPARSGRKVDYKFYSQLEQILGQEAVSLDEYDERDEQEEQDSGTEHVLCIRLKISYKSDILHVCLPVTGADGLNTTWTEQETVALIEVWAADDVQHGLKICVRNSHIFAEISEKMAAIGYLRTAEQCHSRIKRLKKTYRRYCNSRR